MAKENTILAIDAGGDSLKMAEFSFPPSGGFLLERFALVEYERENRDVNFVELFSESYNKLLEEKKFKSKNVRLSISGQTAFSRLSKLPPLGEDRAHIQQIVEYEAKQTVPFPMDEIIWDYQLIKHTLPADKKAASTPQETEEGEDPPPLEKEEGVDEMEALFVAVKSDLVTEVAELIQDSGKEILSIEIAPVAFFNAARANQIGDEQCDLLLNIGGRCSSLVFADKGRIYTRTIPIAGHSITQQVSKEFGISTADAEELKRRHGFVALGGAYEEPDSEVAATVSKIARNVMTRLHGEINRSINVWRSQYGGNRPKRLFLGGGSSLMAYTPRFFNEKLKIPVEYLNSFQVVKLGEEINKEELLEVAPMFAELIGLGLRHVASCPVEISLMPESIRRHKELQPKKPFFYGSAATIISCLLIFYWGVAKRLQFDKTRVEMTQKEVEKTKQLVTKVNQVKGELNILAGQYDEALKITNQRRTWIQLYDELQKILPDKMWFTKIKGIGVKTSNNNALGGGMLFGGGATAKATVTSSGNITTLEFYGHSLVLKQNELLEEQLKKNITASKFFDQGENAVDFSDYIGDKGINNITAFKLRVKLKEPIKI